MQTGKNDIIIFLLITTVIILLLASMIIILLYLYQKKHIAYKQNLDKLKLDHEKNLMAAQLEIQENTFLHISREIHDNINLALTLAKLHLNTLNFVEKEKLEGQVNAAVELIGQSIFDLSDISKSLHSNIISSQGLKTALENEINRIKRAGLFPINLVITGSPVYMNVQKELIIFRIIQEAFNNIIKHAKATAAAVNLHYDKEGLHITLHDDGCGFSLPDLTTATINGKAGLRNMETRAKAINGKMQVDSSINQGTTLTFYIPY